MRKELLARVAALALSLVVMTPQSLAVERAIYTRERAGTLQPLRSGVNSEQTSPLEIPSAGGPSVEGTGTLLLDHVKYMEGFPGGAFRPSQQLTRAQAAQILYRLLAHPDGGTGSCSYTDVPDDQWYTRSVRALCTLGLFEDGTHFYPEDIITRAEFVDLLTRVSPQAQGSAVFPDVPEDHWAARQISGAASRGWINGYPDGTFRPDDGLSRAEACTVINQMLGRAGDAAQTRKLLTLGLFSDMTASHWAAAAVAEAAVPHTPRAGGGGESWTDVNLAGLSFRPGFHTVDHQLYYADREGNLALDTAFGAFAADTDGVLTQVADSYQSPSVPYISQIDHINAWVGCEAVATLMGLRAKGYAADVPLKVFLDNLPRHSSNPEKGFVGSPYVPDRSKRTRTTIYPAKLAEYSNLYCSGQTVCSDFRGSSLDDLRRELLAGNTVVAYMTLWWERPYYRSYNIEGTNQRLVSNNHAVLVCGYDPDRGYFISDPYNYYKRGQIHQYWEDAETFEAIWNERQVGMLLR